MFLELKGTNVNTAVEKNRNPLCKEILDPKEFDGTI